MSDQSNEPTPSKSDFEREAEEEPLGFFAELWDFIRYNKKWWLIPIVVVLVLLGLLALAASTPVGLAIYPLF